MDFETSVTEDMQLGRDLGNRLPSNMARSRRFGAHPRALSNRFRHFKRHASSTEYLRDWRESALKQKEYKVQLTEELRISQPKLSTALGIY